MLPETDPGFSLVSRSDRLRPAGFDVDLQMAALLVLWKAYSNPFFSPYQIDGLFVPEYFILLLW